MNVADAAYATVHDYPGGSESLGPRLGISPAVLRNKANPNNSTHHLTLSEAVRIADVTGDYRVLHAWASGAGYMLVRTDRLVGAADLDVLGAVTALFARAGEVGAAFHAAVADGRVGADEVRAVEREVMRLATAADAGLAALRGMAEPVVQGGEGA